MTNNICLKFPEFSSILCDFPWLFPDFSSLFKIPWLFPDWKMPSHFSRFSRFSSLSGNPDILQNLKRELAGRGIISRGDLARAGVTKP